MPRVQVYLPDDLYHELKLRDWSASELLQKKLREEIKLEEIEKATDEFLEWAAQEYGEPTPEEIAEADASAERLLRGREDPHPDPVIEPPSEGNEHRKAG